VRQHYYKYFHPKEVVLNGCVVCENMNNELLKVIKKPGSQSLMDEKYDIEVVYPFGATLNVVSPANTLITTSTIAYPFNRPVCGYYTNDNGGQILAMGSGHVFTDKYIVNEHNMYFWDYFITLLVEKTIKFKAKDFNDVEVCRERFFSSQPCQSCHCRSKTTQPSRTSSTLPINRKSVWSSRSTATFPPISRNSST
jgi:intraflagellar transport protein 52